jgi:hypothetical protein
VGGFPHALSDVLHLPTGGFKDKALLPSSMAAKQAARAERKDARGKGKKGKMGTKEKSITQMLPGVQVVEVEYVYHSPKWHCLIANYYNLEHAQLAIDSFPDLQTAQNVIWHELNTPECEEMRVLLSKWLNRSGGVEVRELGWH